MNIFQSAFSTLTGVVKGLVESSGIAPVQKQAAHETLDANLQTVLSAGVQDFETVLADIGKGDFSGALTEVEKDAPQLIGEAAAAVAGVAVEQVPVVGAIASQPVENMVDMEVTNLVQHFMAVFQKHPSALNAIVAAAVPATHG